MFLEVRSFDGKVVYCNRQKWSGVFTVLVRRNTSGHELLRSVGEGHRRTGNSSPIRVLNCSSKTPCNLLRGCGRSNHEQRNNKKHDAYKLCVMSHIFLFTNDDRVTVATWLACKPGPSRIQQMCNKDR